VTANYSNVATDTSNTETAWDETLALSMCFESKPQWMEKAACRGESPSLFFPPSGVVSKRAKAVCGSCEVQMECLSYAMSTPDLVGTWGGTSQRGRRALRAISRSHNGDTIG
jgi:WhiB family redox-sensing transcriptional regulator